jgi:hypothetical protein
MYGGVEMRTIWKKVIPVQDSFSLDLPVDAEVLTVQTQHGIPCVWFLCEDTPHATRRFFELRGTGHECGGIYSTQYVGTFQLESGRLVFHLFEVTP